RASRAAAGADGRAGDVHGPRRLSARTHAPLHRRTERRLRPPARCADAGRKARGARRRRSRRARAALAAAVPALRSQSGGEGVERTRDYFSSMRRLWLIGLMGIGAGLVWMVSSRL